MPATRAVVVAVLMLGVAGCTGSGTTSSPIRTTSSAGRTTHAPSPAPSSSAAAAVATPIPYSLMTHCGIDEARVGAVFLEADAPFGDASINAPPGWGTPSQDGTMTMLSSSRWVFRDDLGHQVFFHVRPGATAFKQRCD